MIKKNFLMAFYCGRMYVSNAIISFWCGAKDICTQNKKNCGNHMVTLNKVWKKHHFRFGAVWFL